MRGVAIGREERVYARSFWASNLVERWGYPCMHRTLYVAATARYHLNACEMKHIKR
jgi:hypothetical protein